MYQYIRRNHLAKKALAAAVLAAFCLHASAQQVEQFSLFRENAVALNPAMVGTKGYLAGDLAFRKQFSEISGAPYTAYLDMEGQIADKNIGLGGSFIHDQTGPTGKTGGTVAASYQLKLGKSYDYVNEDNVSYNNENRHMITFGLSFSVMQYRLNGSALHPDQAGDPDLYTSNGNKVTPDASLGVYYQWKRNLYAGAALMQAIGTEVGFNARDGISYIKRAQHLNFLIGGKIEIVKHKFSIDPAGAFRWVKNAPPQGDIGLRLTFYDAIWIGGTYRSLNTAIMDIGIEIKGCVRLSYAYDYNFAPYRGDIGATHEISVGFKFNHDKDVLRDTKFLSGIGKF